MSDKKPAAMKSTAETIGVLTDSARPIKQRAKIFTQILLSSMFDPEQIEQLMREFLETVADAEPAAQAQAIKAEYERALEELKNGPPRPAAFLHAAADVPNLSSRWHVVTPDGQERLPTVDPGIAGREIAAGTTVFLDAKGATVLACSDHGPRTGLVGTFLRGLPEKGCVEISFQEHKQVVHAAQKLRDQIDQGEIKRGDPILWSPQQQMAFTAIPPESDRTFRFVDDSRIPNVDIHREIGSPHWILGWLLKRFELLVRNPRLLQRFHVRPRCSVALTGPSGTGKTLHIRAYLSESHRMLRELTGRDDIGSRTIRVKSTDLLSEYFGVTDRRIDELFDDILALGNEQFEIDGTPRKLPVNVIFEEGEGISRRRGGFDGHIYDRVIGMLLQRLDDPTDDLGQIPLFWITTSNRGELIDGAMWRRLAGMRAHFPRLDRAAFLAVLGKKLRDDLPYASQNGTPRSSLRQAVLDRVGSWMFSPNGDDHGLVELTLRNGHKLIKRRRDFLTGSMTEQAVANAIDATVFAADEHDDAHSGLDAETLIESFCEVVNSVAENLTPANAADYVDVPDEADVASIRRIPGGDRTIATLAH